MKRKPKKNPIGINTFKLFKNQYVRVTLKTQISATNEQEGFVTTKIHPLFTNGYLLNQTKEDWLLGDQEHEISFMIPKKEVSMMEIASDELDSVLDGMAVPKHAN